MFMECFLMRANIVWLKSRCGVIELNSLREHLTHKYEYHLIVIQMNNNETIGPILPPRVNKVVLNKCCNIHPIKGPQQSGLVNNRDRQSPYYLFFHFITSCLLF